METVKVGMREFRENLAGYLESSSVRLWQSCGTARRSATTFPRRNETGRRNPEA